MVQLSYIQCPECLQYLTSERHEREGKPGYVIPEHECFIGARPFHASEAFYPLEVLELEEGQSGVLLPDPAPDLAPLDGEPF